MQAAAGRTREALHRTRLVDDEVVHLLRRDPHHPAAKALQVRQRRMRADRDAMIDREAHGLADRPRITAMEAAGDVGRADVRHHLGVGAHLPRAVALAHVAVEVDALHEFRTSYGILLAILPTDAAQRGLEA